jgi:hypothetical protein
MHPSPPRVVERARHARHPQDSGDGNLLRRCRSVPRSSRPDPNWKATSTGRGVMRQTMRTAIEIDPRSVDILDQAERGHYRIMACTLCGGPEVHAKHKPGAKCLRCGHYRTLDRITSTATRQRCRRCQATFWAVLKTTTCENCRGKWTQEAKIDLQPVRVIRRWKTTVFY